MASLVDIVNHTATGGIDEITIPKAIAFAIRPRTDSCLIYDASDGTAYFTVQSGGLLTVTSANMESSKLYLKATAGVVIEICYQIRG